MRPVEQEPSNECLLRIQNEISEVEKREIELRTEHAMLSPRMSLENADDVIIINEPMKNDQDDALEQTRAISPPSPQVVCTKDNFKKNKIIEPHPKPQLLVAPALTRALSQPQLFNVSPVKISSPHRGIMQKFIASRGKLNVSQVNQQMQNGTTNNNFKKNLIMAPIEFNSDSIKALQNLDKLQIERDTRGKPIRKGYVPVEEKIQNELRDLKNRETELKRLHKLNVRDSEDELSSLEGTDEASWSPINGKLSRSIDVLNEMSSPSPTNLESSKPVPQPRIRPAVSLAALCDLDDSTPPPSSHKLIARWEQIIQVNQQREKSYNIH